MDRAARLAKEREESKAKFSALQEKIKDENQSSLKVREPLPLPPSKRGRKHQ